MVQKLPKKCEKNPSEESASSLNSTNDDFKIAWRYKNVLPHQTANGNLSATENHKVYSINTFLK